jgi:hypothetical protein
VAYAHDHVDARVCGARLHALHVASIDLGPLREVVLRETALHPQTVDVFAQNGAR